MIPISIFLIFLLLLSYLVLSLNKNDYHKLFFKRCNSLLEEKNLSSDFGIIAKNLIFLVDSHSDMKHSESRKKLEEIYLDATRAQCFGDLKDDIDSLFQTAGFIIKDR